jgi:hypothetical protein
VGEVSDKPLGQRAYGHIAHLPGSRQGPGDHHCHEGQGRIATEKARDRHDVITVQEKVDGSCCAVAKIEGVIVPLIRAGYRADTSPRRQHHLFAAWVYERQDVFGRLLRDGERAVGEWLAQAHGTRYALPDDEAVFPIFDLMEGLRRAPAQEVEDRVHALGLRTPPTIHVGGPLSVEAALAALGKFGRYDATDPIEGAVWRVERRGEVDYLVKYVHPEKVDGLYLPEVSGAADVWNWWRGAESVA